MAEEVCPEHLGFEVMPVPMGTVVDGVLAYVNPALARLLAAPREALVGGNAREAITRIVAGALPAWVDALRPELPWEAAEPTWLRLKTPEGPRTFFVQRVSGPRAGERLYLFLDVEGEASARRLTEAFAAAAGELLRARTEHEVLDAAVEVIHRQGFTATVILIEGEFLVHGPMRQDPAELAAAAQLYGRPLEEVRFPLGSLPHLEACLTSRRGSYCDDMVQMLEGFHTPEVLELIRQKHAGTHGVDAPIFVHRVPFGILAVQGRTLTPTSAATIELFARQVGAAIENVRHLRATADQVTALAQLQGELVARERLAAVGEAAAVVAHEVRNPLGAILNGVALIKRGALSPELSPVVGMLEEEAHHLEAVVRDLLDYTRTLEPRLRPVGLGELVRDTMRLFQERQQPERVRFELTDESAGAVVRADPDLLRLALLNLAQNALYASPPAGTVRVRALAGSVVFEDEGAGVPEEIRARIFEPFFTTRARGSGLGLALVRRVADAHGALVRVDSAASGGARFELVLGGGAPPAPSGGAPARQG